MEFDIVKIIKNTLYVLFLISITITNSIPKVKSDQGECAVYGSTLKCYGYIPHTLPTGIVQVIVKNNTVALTEDTFSHVSWRNVQFLDVEEEEQVTEQLVAYTFGNMTGLLELGLHLPAAFNQMSEVSVSAFAGLQNLQHLDLSGCARFSFERLFDLIKNSSNFPKLKALTLKSFNNIGYGTILDLNKTFIELLGHRQIESLIVDKSKVYSFFIDPFTSLCSSLKTFSARHVEVIYVMATKRPGTCRTLKSLDLSGFNFNVPHLSTFVQRSIKHKPTVVANYTDNGNTGLLLSFLANIEKLYLENVDLNIPDIPIHYKIVYERYRHLALEYLSFKGTPLPIIDISVETKVSIHIRGLDLSNCKIRFIGSKTFDSSPFQKISNLFLANNSLHLMEPSDDFSKIFLNLGSLKTLDLSSNRLSSFHPKMLIGNLNIETLDLSHNALTLFYQFVLLPRLRHIDLKENRIDFLDNNSRKWFDSIHAQSNDSQFTLDLRNNSFHCTCAELEFFSWMFTKTFVIYTKPTYCSWNGARIEISLNKLKELQFECTKISYVIRNVGISIGSVIAFIGVITTLFTGVKRILKTYRSRERRRKAICEIRTHSFQYNFLAFLSYSPLDEDIVLKQIHPQLLESLCQITMVNKEFICIGDREFRPGYSMYNEAHRCLHDSAVALVVISQDYCQNAHCKNELEQIVYEGKPLVLIILDPIDELNEDALVKQLMRNSFTVHVDMDKRRSLYEPSLRRLAFALFESVV